MKFILDERFILNEDDAAIEEPGTAAPKTAGAADFSDDNMPQLLTPDEDFWGEYYKSCKTQEEFTDFWNGMSEIPTDANMSPEVEARKEAGFYKYEFGLHAEAVKKLRGEFTKSIEKFGWISRKNPMLSFLHYAFPVDGSIRLNVGPDDFSVLWESLEKGILKQADLQSPDSARLKSYNLIYNNNFYGISSADQRGYLKLQERIINATKFPTAVENKAIVFANIYSINGNLKNATSSIKPGGQLRKLVEAEQVVDELLGKEDAEVEASSEQVTSIIKQIKSKEQAAKMLSYLVDAFSISHSEAIKSANDKTGGKIFAQRNKTSAYPNRGETESFIKLLGSKNTKYNAAILGELLLKLAEAAGIYTPEK